jgi:hypothetical protein
VDFSVGNCLKHRFCIAIMSTIKEMLFKTNIKCLMYCQQNLSVNNVTSFQFTI